MDSIINTRIITRDLFHVLVRKINVMEFYNTRILQYKNITIYNNFTAGTLKDLPRNEDLCVGISRVH